MPHPETLACPEVFYTKESPLHFGLATYKFSGPGQNAATFFVRLKQEWLLGQFIIESIPTRTPNIS